MLVVLRCPTDLDNNYYAREVVGTEGDERIAAFVAFGKRLEAAHKMTQQLNSK